MELDDLHIDIKSFIGNLSESNYTTHKIGTIKSWSFKSPKIHIIWGPYFGFHIRYNESSYKESEFIKVLKLKPFW